MAVRPLTPQEQEELNRLLEENAQISERIRIINEKIATAVGSERQQLEDMMEQEQLRLKLQSDLTKQYQKRKEFFDYEEDKLESIASLSRETLKQIQGQARGNNLIASVTKTIVSMKKKEVNLEGDALETSIARRETLEELQNQVIEAGNAVTAVKKKEQSESEKIEQFERSIAHLTTKQKEEARDLYRIKTALEKKEERLKQLHEQQDELLGEMPDFLQSALKYSKGLVSAFSALGPLALVFALVGAGVHSFLELDKAAEEFRKETGVTISNSKEIVDQAHHIEVAYRNIGVETKMVFDTVKALGDEFGNAVKFSEQTVAALSVMNANLGVGASTAAEVQNVFESVGGLSETAAANVQMQVADMAKMAGVAPKKVLEDIAKSAGTTSKFFKGDINLLKQQAIQAARLGTSLEDVAKTAEQLLDFEGGIEDELVAATMVGGKFNLSRARALAYEKDIIGAQQATLDAIQESGDFREQDIFTQKALAKAAGMEVEEINKLLNQREKLNNLSEDDRKKAEEAIKAGLDISNISEDQLKNKVKEFAKQQEINGQMTKLADTFSGIVATVGGALVPLFEALGPILQVALAPIEFMGKVIKEVLSNMYILVPLVAVLAANYARAAAAAIRERAAAMGTAIANIFSGQAKIPFVGIALAAAGVAAMISMMAKAGDLNSPAKGKTMVSTKEGGLFELSKNDDLVAGPGMSKAVSGLGKNQAANTTNTNTTTTISSMNNNGMALMVNEIKDMKEQLIRGGIKANAYMDGARVTAGVANNVNNSTYNNYGLMG